MASILLLSCLTNDRIAAHKLLRCRLLVFVVSSCEVGGGQKPETKEHHCLAGVRIVSGRLASLSFRLLTVDGRHG